MGGYTDPALRRISGRNLLPWIKAQSNKTSPDIFLEALFVLPHAFIRQIIRLPKINNKTFSLQVNRIHALFRQQKGCIPEIMNMGRMPCINQNPHSPVLVTLIPLYRHYIKRYCLSAETSLLPQGCLRNGT